MSWFKLSDCFAEDPKLLDAGDEATLVFVLGLAYCSRNLTDGAVPRSALRRMIDGDGVAAAQRLVEVGLWEEDGDTFIVTNYLLHQTPSEVVKAKSAKRSAASTTANHDRWHVARGRVATDCHLCSLVGPDVELADGPVRVDVPVPETETTDEVTADMVRQHVAALCDEVVEDGDVELTLTGYRYVIEDLVPNLAAKFQGTKGVGEASLANVAIIHSYRTLIGEEPDTAVMRRLAALRKQHGTRVVAALAQAAAKANGNPLSYATAILNQKEPVR